RVEAIQRTRRRVLQLRGALPRSVEPHAVPRRPNEQRLWLQRQHQLDDVRPDDGYGRRTEKHPATSGPRLLTQLLGGAGMRLPATTEPRAPPSSTPQPTPTLFPVVQPLLLAVVRPPAYNPPHYTSR